MVETVKAIVRTCTYNVLSSNLSNPSHYAFCKPEDCDPKVRLVRLQNKLESEIEQRSIICLQEVSRTWDGPIRVHFSEAGYQYIHVPYGKPFNGYMGVSVAYPAEKYRAKHVEVTRIGDTRERPPKKHVENGKAEKRDGNQKQKRTSLLDSLKALVTRTPDPSPDDDNQRNGKSGDLWNHVRDRWNASIVVVLEDKETSKNFCVATYHMPCVYWDQTFMNVHAALLAQHVQGIANSRSLPYIILGDFNFTPGSSTYELYTKGKIVSPQFLDTIPEPEWEKDEWRLDLVEPLHSAYQVFNLKEPDYTNVSKTLGSKGENEFAATIDFIFFGGPGIEVVDTLPLPSWDDLDVPSFPTKDQPSDHIMIGATFGIY